MGTVTVWASRWSAATNDPVCVTVTCTVNASDGAGEAVTVKLAAVPSVTAEPAVMLISGSDGVTGSSLVMVTEALPEVEMPPLRPAAAGARWPVP